MYPVVSEIPCFVPGPPVYGSVKLLDSTNDKGEKIQVLDFTCNAGYELQGPKQLECSKFGTWIGIPPVCLSKYTCQRLAGQQQYVGET
jgi:hypothetical protein